MGKIGMDSYIRGSKHIEPTVVTERRTQFSMKKTESKANDTASANTSNATSFSKKSSDKKLDTTIPYLKLEKYNTQKNSTNMLQKTVARNTDVNKSNKSSAFTKASSKKGFSTKAKAESESPYSYNTERSDIPLSRSTSKVSVSTSHHRSVSVNFGVEKDGFSNNSNSDIAIPQAVRSKEQSPLSPGENVSKLSFKPAKQQNSSKIKNKVLSRVSGDQLLSDRVSNITPSRRVNAAASSKNIAYGADNTNSIVITDDDAINISNVTSGNVGPSKNNINNSSTMRYNTTATTATAANASNTTNNTANNTANSTTSSCSTTINSTSPPTTPAINHGNINFLYQSHHQNSGNTDIVAENEQQKYAQPEASNSNVQNDEHDVSSPKYLNFASSGEFMYLFDYESQMLQVHPASSEVLNNSKIPNMSHNVIASSTVQNYNASSTNTQKDYSYNKPTINVAGASIGGYVGHTGDNNSNVNSESERRPIESNSYRRTYTENAYTPISPPRKERLWSSESSRQDPNRYLFVPSAKKKERLREYIHKLINSLRVSTSRAHPSGREKFLEFSEEVSRQKRQNYEYEFNRNLSRAMEGLPNGIYPPQGVNRLVNINLFAPGNNNQFLAKSFSVPHIS